MNTLNQQTVIELLDYNQDTGIFKWKKQRRGISTEKQLGSCNGFGYLRITVLGKSYYAHRLAWLYVMGNMPVNQIDHINGKKDDNRIANLREATPAQNKQNHYFAQSNSKSGHLGISWHKKAKKWQVHICTCKKRKYLGLYEDIDSAKQAYLDAKKELHEFSNL